MCLYFALSSRRLLSSSEASFTGLIPIVSRDPAFVEVTEGGEECTLLCVTRIHPKMLLRHCFWWEISRIKKSRQRLGALCDFASQYSLSRYLNSWRTVLGFDLTACNSQRIHTS